jgi:hypothetical protein
VRGAALAHRGGRVEYAVDVLPEVECADVVVLTSGESDEVAHAVLERAP